MPLEKWEIELRQQLDSVVKDTRNKPAVKPEDVNKKPSSVLPMTLLFIVLAIGLLVAYDLKTDGEVQAWILSKFEKKSEQFEPSTVNPVPVTPQSNSVAPLNVISELNDRISKLEVENKAAINELSEKTSWNSHRIGLMGIIFNENFLIYKNNLDRKNIVFFNRDWTINQMPKCIDLTEEDKEYLKKYIKTNQ